MSNKTNNVEVRVALRTEELKAQLRQLDNYLAAMGKKSSAEALANMRAQLEKINTQINLLGKQMKGGNMAAAEKQFESLKQKAKGLSDALSDGSKRNEEGMMKMNKHLRGMSNMFKTVLGYKILNFFVDMGAKVAGTATEFAKLNREMAITASIASKGRDSSLVAQSLRSQQQALAGRTQYTLEDISGLQNRLAKLGYNANEINQMAKAVVDLSIVTGENLTNSADMAGVVIRAFGLDASRVSEVVNNMSMNFNNSALTLSTFKDAFSQVAPVVDVLGGNFKDMTYILGKLADTGIRGSKAGTRIKNVYEDLSSSTSKVSNFLGHFADNIEGAHTMIDELAAKINGNELSLTEALNLFNKRGRPAAAVMIEMARAAAGSGGFSESLREATEELEKTTIKAGELAESLENDLFGTLEKKKSAWKSFWKSVADAVEPATTKIALLSAKLSRDLKNIFFRDEFKEDRKTITYNDFTLSSGLVKKVMGDIPQDDLNKLMGSLSGRYIPMSEIEAFKFSNDPDRDKELREEAIRRNVAQQGWRDEVRKITDEISPDYYRWIRFSREVEKGAISDEELARKRGKGGFLYNMEQKFSKLRNVYGQLIGNYQTDLVSEIPVLSELNDIEAKEGNKRSPSYIGELLKKIKMGIDHELANPRTMSMEYLDHEFSGEFGTYAYWLLAQQMEKNQGNLKGLKPDTQGYNDQKEANRLAMENLGASIEQQQNNYKRSYLQAQIENQIANKTVQLKGVYQNSVWGKRAASENTNISRKNAARTGITGTSTQDLHRLIDAEKLAADQMADATYMKEYEALMSKKLLGELGFGEVLDGERIDEITLQLKATRLQQKQTAASKQADDKIRADQDLNNARIDRAEMYKDAVFDIESAITSNMVAQSKERVRIIEEERDKTLEIANLTGFQRAEIKRKADERIRKEQIRLARHNAQIQMAEATANLALGLTKVLSQAGLKAVVIAPMIAAMGASYIAQMSAAHASIPKAEKGGKIKGRRHAEGGVVIEAEGGETIMNRGASSFFEPLLAAMNAMGNSGLAFGSTYNNKAASNSNPIWVSVKDINTATAKVRVKQNRASVV